jgi:hypothetical protein
MKTSQNKPEIQFPIFLVIATLAVLAGSGVANASLPALVLSPDGRFLETEQGDPFFWIGDTGWTILKRNPEEVRMYLKDRSEKRFTVIQAMALRTEKKEDWVFIPNHAGELPFSSLDPVILNEAYWEHLDYLVETADTHGLYVVLFTMWGPDADSIFPDPHRNNYQYGRLIGRRYRDQDNVVFSVCGEYHKIKWYWEGETRIQDGPLTDHHIQLLIRIADGLEAGHKGRRLMTIHPDGGLSSSWQFHGADWLDINMHQTFGNDRDMPQNVHAIWEDTQRWPRKPVLNGEPGYENREYADPCPARKLRLEAYWSVFSGA